MKRDNIDYQNKADLNFRWAHSHFVGFVMSRLIWPSVVRVCNASQVKSHYCSCCLNYNTMFDANRFTVYAVMIIEPRHEKTCLLKFATR